MNSRILRIFVAENKQKIALALTKLTDSCHEWNYAVIDGNQMADYIRVFSLTAILGGLRWTPPLG
jgi:hypothetical protein